MDEQLAPFEASVVEAGVRSVMPAYCDVDGLPCHASRELLTAILRERWQFDGIVVSDYGGIEMLRSAHRLTDDAGLVAKLALEAGVDVELPRRDVYDGPLRAALDAGHVAPEQLDEAVLRVLQIKFDMSLFERPYLDEPTTDVLSDLAHDEARVGLDLAGQSMVLVKNDGVLPLDPAVRRVAVIGGAATSPREFLGDYSHVLHLETLIEARRTGSTAFGMVDGAGTITLEDELSDRPTLLDELRGQTLGSRDLPCRVAPVFTTVAMPISKRPRSSRAPPTWHSWSLRNAPV